METCLQPREVVLQYGLLPLQLLAPQLESVASVQAAHRNLAAAATTGASGSKFVFCKDVATALDMTEDECRLLLDMLAAVKGGTSSAHGSACAANLYDLSLFLMAQLYDRETHKIATQDHWPDPSSNNGAQLEASARVISSRSVASGSPCGASNSRMLIKNQLQLQQRQQQAYTRGYAEFLQKHQEVLLKLVMDDSSTAEAWQQQRTAQIQQHKAAQLQLQQPQQLAGSMQQQQQRPPQSLAVLPYASQADSEMTTADDTPAADTAVQKAEPSGADIDEHMQSSPERQLAAVVGGGSGNGSGGLQSPAQDGTPTAAAGSGSSNWPCLAVSGVGAGGGSILSSSSSSLASLARCTSVPPVAVAAAEFDRLGFLLEAVKVPKGQIGDTAESSASLASALLQGSSLGANTAAVSSSGSPASHTARGEGQGVTSSGSNSSSSKLSSYVPGYSLAPSMMMEELLAWMSASWLYEVQQQQLQSQLYRSTSGLNSPAHAGIAQQASDAAVAMPDLTTGPGPALKYMLEVPNTAAAAVAAAAGDLGPHEQPRTSLTAGPTAAAAGGDSGGSSSAGVVGWLGLSASPPSSTMMMATSPPSLSLGLNGLLPNISTTATGPTPNSPASSSGGLGLGSMRINTTRGMVAVAGGTVDDKVVSGVYRGTVIRGPNDVTRDEILIHNCVECHIYVLAPVRLARISNCTDCTVCIGAAGTLLRIDSCERLQLTAAAGQIVVVSCHSCCLHLGTPRQPAVLGDCRFVKLAPFNTRYEMLLEHMATAGLPIGQESLWDQPIVMTCDSSSSGSGGSNSGSGSGSKSDQQQQHQQQQLQQRRPGSSTPSSPHTHGSSGGVERRNAAAGHKPVVLMQPEEFLPLVVPFRGTAGPLAGGAAHPASTHWLPGSHKQQQGPLPPFPYTLPEPFDAALQQQYAVVTELRSRIRGSGLDEGRRNQLQGVIQSYFREWLHSSGAIRQVYDLSKLEGDEVNPAGGSPPAAALREHSAQL